MHCSAFLTALSLPFTRSLVRSLFALLLTLWLLPSPLVQAQTGAAAQDIRTLELGKPIERELAGGQSHSYQITLTAGQYLNVVVEQRGIDVALSLVGPNGKELANKNREARKEGVEKVEWVAATAGCHQLNVKTVLKELLAGKYEIRVVELRAATEQDRALQEARELMAESNELNRAARYDEARPLIERALTIREKVLGPEHTDVAVTLNALANLYKMKGDYLKADPLYQRALTIFEEALGPGHPFVEILLRNFSDLYSDPAKAEPVYQRLLTIQEKVRGPEHPAVADTLSNLANIYSSKGDYAKAEILLKRVLAIREKVLGPEHISVADTLYGLAHGYSSKGDYVQAGQLYQRALTIQEKVRGPEHTDVAGTLNALANVYSEGDDAKAEPLYQRALTIQEKVLGPEHPTVAGTLINLANLYRERNDYAKAEQLYQRALAILEKTENINVTAAWTSLADIYKIKGDYVQAELLYQRALTIWEKAVGPQHLNVVGALSRLAALYVAKGEPTQAITFQLRANAVHERSITLNLATGSERQKLAYLALFSDGTNEVVSLHVRSVPTDPMARNLALTTILQRKGRALDAMTDSIAALRRRANADDRALLDQLQETNSQLARLVLNGPQSITPAEHQARIKNLEEQKEKLEGDISRRSAEFRAQATPVTVEAVQAAIPAQAALVEFASYRQFNPKYQKADERFGAPHYVAYVLPQQGEAKWVELGEAKAIDEAVEKLRQALRDKRRTDVKQLARRVDEKVMRPVRALLGQTRRVFISPDGALNLIPFAALVDERNRYLVQRYDFSYLTSGRDLLRLQVKQPSKQTAMVVANPDFGEEAKAGAAKQRLLVYRPGTKAATGEGAVLAGYYFPPLPGTAREARALKAMMKDATVLVEAQATEAALKQVSSPRLLHIATHGFFLDNQQPSFGEDRLLRRISLEEPEPVVGQIENPLLRAGLALAGANQPKAGGDDGILTALEAAGLDLWGTKLVVLSACDTGVGEVKNGEGVYGLRRALVLAGSETQVMSLWPVSDLGTRDLMIGYYKRLLAGQGRTEALRNTQLEMLRSGGQSGNETSRLLLTKGQTNSTNSGKKDRSHPYYWASFIQSGEWANLDGKR